MYGKPGNLLLEARTYAAGKAGAGGGPYRLPVLSRGRRPIPTREVLEGGKVLRGSPLEGGHH